jgi:hypothetical protein
MSVNDLVFFMKGGDACNLALPASQYQIYEVFDALEVSTRLYLPTVVADP